MLGELVVSIVGRVVVVVLWGGMKLLARALYRAVTLPLRVATMALADGATRDDGGDQGPGPEDGEPSRTLTADADDAVEGP